jgi:hypothetical protein
MEISCNAFYFYADGIGGTCMPHACYPQATRKNRRPSMKFSARPIPIGVSHDASMWEHDRLGHRRPRRIPFVHYASGLLDGNEEVLSFIAELSSNEAN